MATTVGELRKLIAKLPDSTRVIVDDWRYSGEYTETTLLHIGDALVVKTEGEKGAMEPEDLSLPEWARELNRKAKELNWCDEWATGLAEAEEAGFFKPNVSSRRLRLIWQQLAENYDVAEVRYNFNPESVPDKWREVVWAGINLEEVILFRQTSQWSDTCYFFSPTNDGKERREVYGGDVEVGEEVTLYNNVYKSVVAKVVGIVDLNENGELPRNWRKQLEEAE